jgi:cytochrome c-type biogenesis protein
MLLCYSLGLGVPFIVAGLAFGRLAGVFAWVRAHLGAVNLVSGLLLAGLGVLLLTDNIHRLSNWFIKLPGLNRFNL